MGTISASSDAHETSAGNTVDSEMKDRSATTMLDRSADGRRCQLAHVGAFQHRHPLVRPQRPCQLPVSDVDGDHLAGTAIEQHLGEPAGRGTGVQAARIGHRDAEGVQRADELVRTAGDP